MYTHVYAPSTHHILRRGIYIKMDYATLLRTDGVTVIPCIPAEQLPNCRALFDQTVQSFPEFKPNAPSYVMGGFSALGNPSSFHNLFVRRLRQWCMYSAVTELFRDYIQRYKPHYNLEQCIDRMMKRPRGVAPSAESWHRDIAKGTGDTDETFGGWLNLDDADQAFSCVPGTHKDKPDKQSGFALIRDKGDIARYKAASRIVIVPPGHMIVFFEHIVHEVRNTKAAYDMYRLFTGWRITNSETPLHPGMKNMMMDQAVMPLKSNQTPPMYASLHWTNWVDHIVEFSRYVDNRCLEFRRVESGKNKGTVYHVVQRHLRSLRDYDMPMYPAYAAAELQMHVPRRKWSVLAPCRTRIKSTIEL